MKNTETIRFGEGSAPKVHDFYADNFMVRSPVFVTAIVMEIYSISIAVEERAIANQTGHRSTTILRRYIRDASLFTNNAAGKVGL